MKIRKDFKGYAGDPKYEDEVIFLFGLLQNYVHKYLGMPFVITEIRKAFPDCKGINPDTGETILIEFELNSSDYNHPDHGCDYIVCWEDDRPHPTIPVISLKALIKAERLEDKCFLHVHQADSVWARHERNREEHPEVYEAVDYFVKTLIPSIQKRCPYLTFQPKPRDKRFLFRFKNKSFPLLEIDPNGIISGKTVEDIMKNHAIRQGDDLAIQAATDLKSEITRIRFLNTRSNADSLARKLEQLIKTMTQLCHAADRP